MSFKSKNKDPGDKKHQGFVSSLFHRHSDDNEKNAKAAKSTTLAKSPETPPQFPRVDATSSKPELAGKPEPSSTAPPIKPPPTTSVPAKKGRREESEKRLEDAAVALSKSMSKSPIELPDAIGLQHLGNIKDVEGTAKQLESAVDGIIDKRQIKANADSRRVWKDCIKHWFKAIYPYVNFGLEQVKDFVPTPYGYVASAVLYILEHVYDAMQLAEELEEAIKTLTAILERIQVTEGFKDVLTDAQLDEVYCAALILAACVTDYLARAIAYLDGSLAKAFFGGKEFDESKSAIDSAAQKYVESMGFLTATMTAELLHHDKSERREKILTWLWTGDYWKRHQLLRSQRVANTGDWFLECEAFQKWKSGTGTSLLISLGIPGAGKSFISSLVIDNLRTQTNILNPNKVGVIQFYFDDHDPNNQTADDVIRSFVKQIVYQMNDKDVPKLLEKLFDAQISQGKSVEPSRDQFVGLLAACFEKFMTVYICIDAFDECVPVEGLKVLKGLQQLSARKYRLFLTGRTYVFETPTIRADEQTRIWLRDASYQPISAARADIETYLNEQLRAIATISHMDEIKPRIVNAISSQSNGQFLLARFQLKFVLGYLSQPKKLIQALDHMPLTMQDIYDEIMQRIKDSEPGDQDLAIRALSWVFHTAKGTGSRPLNMDEILDLISIEIDDTEVTEESLKSLPDDLLHACRGLLVVDDDTNTVRFPHLTVLEYFRKSKDLHSVSDLVQVSITYFNFTEFETECDDWIGIGARLGKYKAGEFLAKHWAYYARDAQSDQTLHDQIFTWLNSEKRCRSMIQMLLYHESVKGPDEVWYDMDWLNWKLESHSIMRLLVNNGLGLLCELFLDGKTSIKEGDNSKWTTRDLATISEDGMTPLHAAAENGYREIAENLIRRGANLNLRSSRDNYTPLMYALSKTHKEVAVFLLEKGAEVGDDEFGTGPLTLAYDKDLVKMLLDRGANAKGNPEFLDTPLIKAASKGSGDVIRMLVDHGADIEARTPYGQSNTALHMATWYGNVDAMKALLEKGASIEARGDPDGQNVTPLHVAAMFSISGPVKLLLEKGADINALGQNGFTSLHHAAWASRPNLEVVDLLVQRGANIEARTIGGHLPLHKAALQGNAAVVEYLFNLQSKQEQGNSGSVKFKSFEGKTRVQLLSSLHVTNPEDEISLSLLGQALWIDGQSDKAMEMFERLIEINPANASATEVELQHRPTVKCGLGCGREIVGVYHIYPPFSPEEMILESNHYQLCDQCFSAGTWHEHVEGLDDEKFVRIPRETWWNEKNVQAGQA